MPTTLQPGDHYRVKVTTWDERGQCGQGFSGVFSLAAKPPLADVAPPVAEPPPVKKLFRPEPVQEPEAPEKPADRFLRRAWNWVRSSKVAFLALALIAALALILIVAITGQRYAIHENLARLSGAVDRAWAQVYIQYQRRADLIPNLTRTVERGAPNFDRSALADVVNARAHATKVTLDPSKMPSDPQDLRRFQLDQDALGATLGRLLALSERYPELIGNANFRDLQTQIEGAENRIAVARRDFNQAVQNYNDESQR